LGGFDDIDYRNHLGRVIDVEQLWSGEKRIYMPYRDSLDWHFKQCHSLLPRRIPRHPKPTRYSSKCYTSALGAASPHHGVLLRQIQRQLEEFSKLQDTKCGYDEEGRKLSPEGGTV
jgi:hypothetical protein